MATIDTAAARVRGPAWLWMAAAFGVAWNVFGLVQLADVVTQTRASLMMKGMSAAAADIYYALPLWMNIAFAIGAGGGVAGSLLLAARRRTATRVFAVSLAGYVTLYLGDYLHGIFAIMPGQMAVLSFVVAVAAALLAVSVIARRRGILR